MKHLIYLLPLLFLCSCARFGTGTEMYYSNGRVAFATSGDATGLDVDMVKAGAGRLRAVTLTHSSTVIARGTAYSEFVTAAGAAVGQGAKAFAKP